MKIVVMGQGYVGLPLAMAASQAGHDVIGYDPNAERTAQLATGRSYVEDVSDAELSMMLISQLAHKRKRRRGQRRDAAGQAP